MLCTPLNVLKKHQLSGRQPDDGRGSGQGQVADDNRGQGVRPGVRAVARAHLPSHGSGPASNRKRRLQVCIVLGLN